MTLIWGQNYLAGSNIGEYRSLQYEALQSKLNFVAIFYPKDGSETSNTWGHINNWDGWSSLHGEIYVNNCYDPSFACQKHAMSHLSTVWDLGPVRYVPTLEEDRVKWPNSVRGKGRELDTEPRFNCEKESMASLMLASREVRKVHASYLFGYTRSVTYPC